MSYIISNCDKCKNEIRRKSNSKRIKFYCSKCRNPRKKYYLYENQVINNCTLIKKTTIIGRNFWTCKCICNIEFTRREDYITMRLNKNLSVSCNCMSNTRKRGKDHHAYKGCGDLSSVFFNHIKSQATERQLCFELTIEQLWQKFLDQNKKCALSGVELSMSESRRINSDTTASLDRIDSAKGYTIDNIQWVHKYINIFKNTCDNQEFIKWCHLIAKHNPL